MLEEYFALKLDKDGLVQEIPLLLRDYQPNLDKLPLFLMRLGPQVCIQNRSRSSLIISHTGRLVFGKRLLRNLFAGTRLLLYASSSYNAR